MFVGEQPGDQEDKSGHPFVGPAGNLLSSMLEKVRIDGLDQVGVKSRFLGAPTILICPVPRRSDQ